MKTYNYIPATVTNASNIMALSVVRSLGRRQVPVNAFFGRNDHHSPYNRIVRQSRYIDKSYDFEESRYAENMISLLIDVGRKNGDKSVLFPVSDQDMIIISEHRQSLSDYYHLLMPDHDVLDTLLSKEKFYSFALSHGLPIPQTYFPHEGLDVVQISRTIEYPCIMKPSWRDGRWLDMFHNTKVIICSTPEELISNYHQLLTLGYNMLIQEILHGEENNISCSFTYLNELSEMLGVVVCKKIRQFPRDFGNTSLAETLSDENVVELTRGVCKKLKLSGYVSIEFKMDPKTNSLKIIEITPSRINRHAGIADVAGFDIPWTWYDYLSNGRVATNTRFEPEVKWLSEVNELRTLWDYLTDRDYSILRLLRSYKNIKRCEIWSRDDLKPFIHMMLSVLRYLFPSKSVASSRGKASGECIGQAEQYHVRH